MKGAVADDHLVDIVHNCNCITYYIYYNQDIQNFLHFSVFKKKHPVNLIGKPCRDKLSIFFC